jgi:hypothetical protein
MSGETRADLPVLDAMSRSLTHGADALDSVGKGSPGVPDAGEASAIMGAGLARLTENAANVVLGMKGASEEVRAASREYADKDQAVAQSLPGR